MAKLLAFPARSVRARAKRLLRLTASRERLNKPTPWEGRPVLREPLGNMLQRLARVRPHAVLVLESIVADMLRQLEDDRNATNNSN
jgi:hypothetical protein